MEDQNLYTPIDIITQTKEMQIIKSIVPFLPNDKQKTLVMLIQFMQFQKTMEILDNPPAELSAASCSNESGNFTAMLGAIRRFCSDKEKETIDSLVNVLCLIDKEKYNDF